MNLIKLCCILMSVALSFLSGTSANNNHISVDVRQADGRMVIWKEDSYIEVDDELIFKCREGEKCSIYISYDDGKSYGLLYDVMPEEEFIVSSQRFNEQICIKFISDKNNILFGNDKNNSREFRIKFLNCNTFTET